MGFEELFRPEIIDHHRNPRHTTPLAEPDTAVEMENKACSFDDRTTVAFNVREDAVAGVWVDPRGCAFTTASSSMLAEAILGRSLDDVAAMAGDRLDLLAAGADPDVDAAWKEEGLGEFAAFEGVRRFPQRRPCVEMPWRALLEALEQVGGIPTNDDRREAGEATDGGR